MSGFSTKDKLLAGTAQTVGASQTALAVSAPFIIRDPLAALTIDIHVTATTVAAGVTLLLQVQLPDGTWTSLKSTTVANAFTGIKTQTYNPLLSTDQAQYPLRPMAQVVATTGAGDSITVDHVYVTQAWGGQN